MKPMGVVSAVMAVGERDPRKSFAKTARVSATEMSAKRRSGET